MCLMTAVSRSAYGLDSTWEVVSRLLLPTPKAGVVGGIMLGAWAAGTGWRAMAVTFGTTSQLDSLSLFQACQHYFGSGQQV
jgi:phosphate transport system permease protein